MGRNAPNRIAAHSVANRADRNDGEMTRMLKAAVPNWLLLSH
jgi:hypothetical protein